MQRQSDPPGGVTLTEHENEIVDLYLQIIIEDSTLSLQEAARYALSALPHPDPAFVAWLTSGEVIEHTYS